MSLPIYENLEQLLSGVKNSARNSLTITAKYLRKAHFTAREKSLIALAVSHVVKCPYCIDAYTQDGLKRGITKEEMMEAVHAGAAIESGATLVHSVQMMNKYKKLSM